MYLCTHACIIIIVIVILGRADYAQGTSLVPDPIKINTMNVVAT